MVESGCFVGGRRCGLADVKGGQGNDGAEQHRLVQGFVGNLCTKSAMLIAEVEPRRESLEEMLKVLGNAKVLQSFGWRLRIWKGFDRDRVV